MDHNLKKIKKSGLQTSTFLDKLKSLHKWCIIYQYDSYKFRVLELDHFEKLLSHQKDDLISDLRKSGRKGVKFFLEKGLVSGISYIKLNYWLKFNLFNKGMLIFRRIYNE